MHKLFLDWYLKKIQTWLQVTKVPACDQAKTARCKTSLLTIINFSET